MSFGRHGSAVPTNIQSNVRLADGDEAGGFLVALEQTFLQQIVVHAYDADLEATEVAAQLGDAALESESENKQPIAIALVTACFDRFGDGLFAHGAELWADVQMR